MECRDAHYVAKWQQGMGVLMGKLDHVTGEEVRAPEPWKRGSSRRAPGPGTGRMILWVKRRYRKEEGRRAHLPNLRLVGFWNFKLIIVIRLLDIMFSAVQGHCIGSSKFANKFFFMAIYCFKWMGQGSFLPCGNIQKSEENICVIFVG